MDTHIDFVKHEKTSPGAKGSSTTKMSQNTLHFSNLSQKKVSSKKNNSSKGLFGKFREKLNQKHLDRAINEADGIIKSLTEAKFGEARIGNPVTRNAVEKIRAKSNLLENEKEFLFEIDSHEHSTESDYEAAILSKSKSYKFHLPSIHHKKNVDLMSQISGINSPRISYFSIGQHFENNSNFLKEILKKKKARVEESKAASNQNRTERKIKSLSRISRLNPSELQKDSDLMHHFKQKVNYRNMNSSKYDHFSSNNDADSIQRKLTEIQNDEFTRDPETMRYCERLLESMHHIKSPSLKAIYRTAFDEAHSKTSRVEQ
ncbi:unnamed protein product [Moneuplotes crassus]|uniref:Uncharacterized protein n=1 Tax=Euplotes crassus TaxID=5936 RepID=A0AAD1X1H2_EUPCR|nr:unnamed protein product [Moneuplotes crassus]